MSNTVSLLVNGKTYDGWKNARVARSMDFLSSNFELQVTSDKEFLLSDWQIKMEDEVIVRYNGSSMLSGYVEDLDIQYDDKTHSVYIAGRDKTGDLVDCARPDEPKQWKNKSIQQLVTTLCSPFGISVSVDSSATTAAAKVESLWSYNEGETVFDAIKRLCLKEGIIPLSHGDGKLVLTKLGLELASDTIERGVNVLIGGLKQSNKERFKDYYVKGFGFGLDTKKTTDYIQPKGDAVDSVMQRYRPFVIMNEGAATISNCKERARWESQLRAGNSRAYTYVLRDWEQSTGQLWELNTKVKVKDKTLGVEDTFLINSLGFEMGEGGTLIAIGLVSTQKYEAKAKLDLSKTKTAFDLGSL